MVVVSGNPVLVEVLVVPGFEDKVTVDSVPVAVELLVTARVEVLVVPLVVDLDCTVKVDSVPVLAVEVVSPEINLMCQLYYFLFNLVNFVIKRWQCLHKLKNPFNLEMF